jgi:hypothetical protein
MDSGQTEFDFTPSDHFDICGNKHGGNPESEEAFASIDPHLGFLQSLAEELFLEAGFRGLIPQDVDDAFADRFGEESRESGAPRCSELKRRGILVRKRLADGSFERRPTRAGHSAGVLIHARLIGLDSRAEKSQIRFFS